MPRGGKRPGAGRPRKNDRKKTFNFRLDVTVTEAAKQKAYQEGNPIGEVIEKAFREYVGA